MGWRDWSYTKRGAIVGGVIGYLIGAGFWVIVGACNGFADSTGCGFLKSIIWPGNIISGIIILIPGFLLGALFGFIIGKIKSRKQIQPVPIKK